MYKIVFIDIDDTLRNSKKEVTERTKETIKKVVSKGILVVLCSGRPRKYAENVSKECFASKYIISSGGGSVYNYEDEENIHISSMTKEAVLALYNLAISKDIRIIMHIGDRRVTNRLKHENRVEELLDMPIEEFLESNLVTQCVVLDDDFDKIKSLKAEIEKISEVYIANQAKCLTNSNIKPIKDIYYDVTSINTSKGNGVKKLCEYLNIDLKDSIAIGDDYNDISMLKIAGKAVVMENANDEIKQYADEIAEINENDGVARFLEKLFNT